VIDCSHCKKFLSYIKVKRLLVQLVPTAPCLLNVAPCEEQASVLVVAVLSNADTTLSYTDTNVQTAAGWVGPTSPSQSKKIIATGEGKTGCDGWQGFSWRIHGYSGEQDCRLQGP